MVAGTLCSMASGQPQSPMRPDVYTKSTSSNSPVTDGINLSSNPRLSNALESANRKLAPADFVPHVSPKAIAYQRTGRTVELVRMFWNLLGISLFIGFGLPGMLSAVLATSKATRPKRPDGPPTLCAVTLLFAVYSAFIWLWNAPFVYEGYRIESNFGFATESLNGAFRDSFITALLGLVIVPVLWAAFRIQRKFPVNWWLLICVGIVPLSLIATIIQPILIAPLYNKFIPMPPCELQQHILQLASRAGVNNPTVLIENTSVRTRHVNAYVTGVGYSARIVINDTALRELPEDQILAMLGHEMGHFVERHVLVGFFTSAIGLVSFVWIVELCLRQKWFLKMGIRTLGNGTELKNVGSVTVAIVPNVMLLMMLFLLLQSPIENTISRYLEYRADRYGLQLTRLNDATALLMKGFAERDLADPNPPALLHFWFGSHPTLTQRITFARDFVPNK